MVKTAKSAPGSDDVRFDMRVDSVDGDLLLKFLEKNGLRAHRHSGFKNSFIKDASQVATENWPYLAMYGTADRIAKVLTEYLKSQKKELSVERHRDGKLKSFRAKNISEKFLLENTIFDINEIVPREEKK